MELFGSGTGGEVLMQAIIDRNDEIMKNLLRKKGRAKKVPTCPN